MGNIFGALPGTNGNVEGVSLNRVRASMVAAENLNINDIGLFDSLAKDLDLNFNTVAVNPYQARVEATARKLEEKENLLKTKWAQYDAANAALVRDDAALDGVGKPDPLVKGFERGQYVVLRSQLANLALEGDDAARQQLATLEKKFDSKYASEEEALAEKVYYTGETGEPFYSRLGVAAEQLPIMFQTTVKPIGLGLQGASAAAVAAFVAGQSGPQVAFPEEIITVPGAALLGGVPSYLSGVALESFNLESGSIAADLLGVRDANGNPLSDEEIRTAKNIYGTAAAIIESGGSGAFLKILSRVGLGRIGSEGAKAIFRSSVLKAATDKSKMAALLAGFGGVLGGAAIEGGEESAQEFAQILTESAIKSFAPGYFLDTEVFTKENASQVVQAGLKGFEAGLYLGVLPVAVSTIINTQRAGKARAFRDAQIVLHNQIEQTKTKQISPERMVTFLETTQKMTGDIYLPADAVETLYQNGVDIFTPLGFTVEEVQEASAAGQDLSIPLSEAHSFLSMEEFEHAAKIMRASPEAYSQVEVANTEEFDAEQERTIAEAYNEYAAEQQNMESETTRLHDEFTRSIEATPNLSVETIARAGGSKAVANDLVNLAIQYANRMSAYGQSPAQFLSKISVRALFNSGAIKPETMNYEEGVQHEISNIADDLKGHLQGKLSAASLRETWPGAYKEIVKAGNAWVFNKRNTGFAPDELAASFEEEFRGGAERELTISGDDLIEMLKSPERFRKEAAQIVAPRQGQARGVTQISQEGYLIGLFRNANLSTLIHEMGHVFHSELGQAVDANEGRDAQLAEDYQKLNDWLGYKPEQKKLNEEQKEKFARGFEAYLREGKAPTEELQDAFGRFKKWLMHIYQKASDLNVELTDDVRQVFDRLFAYDVEVENTASMNNLSDLAADELGIFGDSKLITKAKERAKDFLHKIYDGGRAARVREYREAAIRAVDSDPFYSDVASIVENGGIDMETARYVLDSATIKGINKKHGKVFTEGGGDIQLVAAEYGYDSGNGLVSALVEMQSRKDAIQEKVDKKIAKDDSKTNALDALLGQKEVQGQLELIGRYFADAVGQKPISEAQYKGMAAALINKTSMRNAIRRRSYLSAFQRAWNKERGILLRRSISENIKAGKTAQAQKDMIEVMKINHQARLNLEMMKYSEDIVKLQNSVVNKIKNYIHQKSANADARYVVMSIAMNHGLGKYVEKLGEGRNSNTIVAWQAEMKDRGYEISLDQDVVSGQTPWQDMSVEQFENLAESVVHIITAEKNDRKLTTFAKKQELNEVVSGISNSVYENNTVKISKTVQKENALLKTLGHIHASHSKIEAICIALDGGKIGEMHESVYQPIASASDKQALRFRDVSKALREIFGIYEKQHLAGMGIQRKFIESIGESLSRENMICVALNMGNEVNYSRIKEGHGWSDQQIQDIVSNLTEKDWEFVAAFQEYLGTFKDESFDLEQRMTGIRPKGVEAKPFVAPTGQKMPGGYYPIKYDFTKSSAAYEKSEKEIDQALFGSGSATQAMTRKGHLKSRTAQGLGVPLDLSFTVGINHIFDAVHDIYFRETVLDIAKIIRHKDFRKAVESTSGVEMYKQFMSWLKDVANDRQEPMAGVDRWAHWARSGSTQMVMGYKFTTMITQVVGISQSISYVGAKWIGAGIKTVYSSPLHLKECYRQTTELSAFMADRINSYDRDIKNISNKLTPSMTAIEVLKVFRDHAFTGIGVLQLAVDLPTWWGAYHKSMAENGLDEARAIKEADSAVRMSQGSGRVEDLAKIQRGPELQKLFTMFYGYFSVFYNLSSLQFKQLKQDLSPAAIMRACYQATLLWFVPAVLSELLAGRGPDEDDGEEWLTWASQNLITYPFQAIVGVRDIANAMLTEYGYKTTPAEASPEAMVKWAHEVIKLIKGEETKDIGKKSVQAIGYLLRLPLGQAIISTENIWAYINGDDPDFYLRDLIFTKPQSRR